MVGVMLMGLLGYYLLPISALPPVDFPTIQVTAQYPGASSGRDGVVVTTPLERQFGQISGLATMTSASSFGNSTITLQFTLDRTSMPRRRTCRRRSMPRAAFCQRTCRIRRPTARSIPPTRRSSRSRSPRTRLPLEKVNDLADTVLAQKLSEVSGVGLVTIEGNQKPAVRVRVNPAAIASLGLSLEDVRTALLPEQRQRAQRQLRRRRASPTPSTRTTRFFPPPIIATSSSLTGTARPFGSATSATVVDNVENVGSARGSGRSRAKSPPSCSTSSASRARTSSRPPTG